MLNLAYGVYIMLGGYMYYTAVQVLGLPKIGGFAFAIASGIAFAVLTYTILVRRLEENPVAVEISTLILAVVMQSADHPHLPACLEKHVARRARRVPI